MAISKRAFFVPEKNIILMNNEYFTSRILRTKPGLSYNPPLQDNKFDYNFEFFEEDRRDSFGSFFTSLRRRFNANTAVRAGG